MISTGNGNQGQTMVKMIMWLWPALGFKPTAKPALLQSDVCMSCAYCLTVCSFIPETVSLLFRIIIQNNSDTHYQQLWQELLYFFLKLSIMYSVDRQSQNRHLKTFQHITQAVDGRIPLERSKKDPFVTRAKEIHQMSLEREMKVLSVSETFGVCEVFLQERRQWKKGYFIVLILIFWQENKERKPLRNPMAERSLSL